MLWSLGEKDYTYKKASNTKDRYNNEVYEDVINIKALRYGGVKYVRSDMAIDKVNGQVYQTTHDISVGDILDGKFVKSVNANFDILGNFCFNIVEVE